MIPIFLNKYHVTNVKMSKLEMHLPIFFIGVILCDMETMPSRPLDNMREMNAVAAGLRNVLLLGIAIIWGSYTGNQCLTENDGRCDFWEYATAGGYIQQDICLWVAAFAIILLALTSPATQAVLSNPVI